MNFFSRLTEKTPKHWRRSNVCICDFEQISHIVLFFSFWTNKCQLGGNCIIWWTLTTKQIIGYLRQRHSIDIVAATLLLTLNTFSKLILGFYSLIWTINATRKSEFINLEYKFTLLFKYCEWHPWVSFSSTGKSLLKVNS